MLKSMIIISSKYSRLSNRYQILQLYMHWFTKFNVGYSLVLASTATCSKVQDGDSMLCVKHFDCITSETPNFAGWRQCSICRGGPLDEDDLPSGGRKFWSGVGFDLLTAVPTKISEWERRYSKNVDSLLAVSAPLLVIQQLLITYLFFFGQYFL